MASDENDILYAVDPKAEKRPSIHRKYKPVVDIIIDYPPSEIAYRSYSHVGQGWDCNV